MTTESPHGATSRTDRKLGPLDPEPDRNYYAPAVDEQRDDWQPLESRWAWWVMISIMTIGVTVLVVNWVGWDNLPVAARLIVLVELFLVSLLVLFLVVGERFAEWAGYGSLWANDGDRQSDLRAGLSRSDRQWNRDSQIQQFLRRTYYEVRCQDSTLIPANWQRTQPMITSPLSESRPPRTTSGRPASPVRERPTAGAPIIPPPPQSAPQLPSAATPTELGALEPAPPAALKSPTSPRTCRPTSRIEIRRRD